MTKVTILQPKDRLSFSYKVVTDTRGEFVIPVVDVRDGPAYEIRAAELERGGNQSKGSKYMRPKFSWVGFSYNQSMKKKK